VARPISAFWVTAMSENRAYLRPIHHTRPCTCQRARCGTGRNPVVDSTAGRGQNQFENIATMALRHTSSGWDGCLSAIAERRRTWRRSSARSKRDGLTRLPRQIVRVMGRIRVRKIIERDNINPAASFQKPVATSRSRSRRKSVSDPECGELKDGQGSTLELYCRFK